MLTFSIFAILVLGVWHLVYESVFAPTMRMGLRNELFRLRDELRRQKIDGNVRDSEAEVFEFVHDGLNRFLNRLAYLNLFEILMLSRRIESNSILLMKTSRRFNAVNASSNVEIRRIFNKANVVVSKALFVNLGAWAVYLVPILVVYVCFASVKTAIGRLLMIPPREAQQYFAEHAPSVA